MAVAGAVTILLNTLCSLLKTEVDLISKAQIQLDRLKEDLSSIKAVVEDASTEEDLFVKWAKELREVIYDAEDVIDIYIAKVKFSSSNCIIPDRKVARQLHLASKLRSLREQHLQPLMDRANIGFVSAQRLQSIRYSSDEIKAFKGNNVRKVPMVVGFKDETDYLINQLYEEKKVLDVIPLVGMGGIGKTTLAQLVYNDSRTLREFPTRVWVNVSKELEFKLVLVNIMNKFTEQDMSNKSVDELSKLVSKYLRTARFLIVLDDMWSIDPWVQIQKVLPKTNRMGKILITTRNEKVALHASSTREPYRLRMLNHEQSWELLRFKAFGKNNDCPPDLESLGRRIAERCSGLPLATVTIGGILAQGYSAIRGTDALRTEWQNLCDSIDHRRPDNMEKRTENVIQLSYSSLPSALKPCFLYLGAFPEDYEISVHKLIPLWVAEGLICQKPENSMEETAKEYLDDLVSRSLLMLDKISITGDLKTCRVHDIIRDFCIKQASFGNHNLFQEIKMSKAGTFEPLISVPRRICVHSHVKDFLSSYPKDLKARSLLCFSKTPMLLENKDIKNLARAFKMLRVVHADPVKLPKFPRKLTRLHHLKYVSLSGNFETLPAAINNLWNLEVLVVYTLSRILEIKADIWEFEHLRHLQTNASIFLKKEGKGKGGKNLQTLGKLSPCSYTDDVSKKLRSLTVLGICGALSDSMCFGNLASLKKLKLLHVSSVPLPGLPQPNSFPPNLKSLVLSGTNLDWKHMCMLENLPTLELLKLKDNAFVGDSWDVAIDGFGRLSVLFIAHTNLKYWMASDNSFPKLSFLKLENCPNLEEIPLHLGKTLDKLYMSSVTKFAVSCAKKIELAKELKDVKEPKPGVVMMPNYSPESKE